MQIGQQLGQLDDWQPFVAQRSFHFPNNWLARICVSTERKASENSGIQSEHIVCCRRPTVKAAGQVTSAMHASSGLWLPLPGGLFEAAPAG
jgi:hypothetical protein